MKVYLMTDLEGVAGVLNAQDYLDLNGPYYALAKELLTMEANAAIDGFFAGGADEIVVQDGHGEGGINQLLLDPRAKLQRGWDGPGGGYYPHGLDESYDVIAWVGQHPKSGTEFGHLCHTGSFGVLDFQINGISVGELGKQLFLANTFGVVPIFASGCLALTKEARHFVEGIETVAVKEGVRSGTGDECTAEAYSLRNSGAIHLHPQVARKLIREGAERAMRRYLNDPASFRPMKISAPYSKKITTRDSAKNKGSVYEKSGFDDLALLLNS